MHHHSDMHKHGCFAVKTPQGEVLFETFAATAYSARAAFLSRQPGPWSRAEAQGYTLAEFAQVGVVTARPRETVQASPLAALVPRSVAGWDLYDKPGAEEAAVALGAALTDKLTVLLASNEDRRLGARRIRDEMLALMDNYEKLGARDTEPEVVLTAVLARALDLEDFTRFS